MLVVLLYINKFFLMFIKYVCYVYSVGKERLNWDDIMFSGIGVFRNIIIFFNIEVL